MYLYYYTINFNLKNNVGCFLDGVNVILVSIDIQLVLKEYNRQNIYQMWFFIINLFKYIFYILTYLHNDISNN